MAKNVQTFSIFMNRSDPETEQLPPGSGGPSARFVPGNRGDVSDGSKWCRVVGADLCFETQEMPSRDRVTAPG